MEINPRGAFERLFGDGGSDARASRNLREDRSILDGILNDMRALQARLGAHDRARVDDYLRRRARDRAADSAQRGAAARRRARSTSRSASPTHSRRTRALMTDLLALAFQAELTHVFTFMMSREGSQRTFSQIGVTDPWHVDLASRRQGREDREQREDQRVLPADVRATAREAAARRPTATARCSITR